MLSKILSFDEKMNLEEKIEVRVLGLYVLWFQSIEVFSEGI